LGALKAITLDAAYSMQMEKEVGSIVPGKLANFTILAENPRASAHKSLAEHDLGAVVIVPGGLAAFL
jgi:imidazolonepropionase-like amidohydrolase